MINYPDLPEEDIENISDDSRMSPSQARSPTEEMHSQDPRMQSYVNAPTTNDAYGFLPSSAAPPTVQSPGGFNWARALTAFSGGDVGAYDARQNRSEEAPLRKFQFQQAQQDAEYKQQERLAEQQRIQESLSPQSKLSREAQRQFQATMTTMANLPGMTPEAQAQLSDFAQNASNMSASQIARAQLNIQPLIGNVLKSASTQATSDLANKRMGLSEQQLAATIANQAAGRNMQGAELGESIRHHQALENAPIQAKISQGKADQEKLNKEINDIDFSIDQMNKLEGLQKKVNTGPIAGRVNDLLSKVDLAPKEFNELKALTARVFNKETKSLAGSAVSASEWSRIEPMIPSVNDDDNLYRQKLRTAMDAAKDILSKRREEYRMKSGAPLDQSVTAQKNNPLLPGNTDPNSQPNPVDQNSSAMQWLKNNPDDPRAAAVRRKLGL